MKPLSPELVASRLRGRHLALFHHVCELRTLRKAAAAAHLTQPAATKLVREMEHILGATLFVRDRRGMHPTLAGDVVRRHVAVLLADIAGMTRELDLASRGVVGHIRLGLIPSLSSQLLARSLGEMKASNAVVRFSMQEGATTPLLAALMRNELDLTFGRVVDARTASALRVVPLYRESFAVACAVDHPLATRRRVTWRSLAQEQWALPAGDTPLRGLVDGLFTRQGIMRPDTVIESSSFDKLVDVIAASDVVGVLPQGLARAARDRGLVVVLKEALGEDFPPISLLLRKDVDQPPAVERFVAIVLRNATALRDG